MDQLLSAKKSQYFFILFFLLMFCTEDFCLGAEEKAKTITTIKNLQNDLLMYDEGLDNYMPFIPNNTLSFPALSYYLNLNLYSGYKIQHCVPLGSSLFIDQKIVDFSKDKSCKTYSIDSLKKIYQKDTVFITIYNASLTPKNLNVSVISEDDKNQVQKVSGILTILSREFSGFNDFFIIGIIILMVLIAILHNRNGKYFHEFYNLRKALSLKIRDENYISVKNISGTYLLFLFVHSFLVGFILLTIVHYHEAFHKLFVFINTAEFWAASLSWLQTSLIIFAFFLAKYILVRAISELFNIKNFSTIHFFDFMRMSISFFLLILIALCILIFTFGFEEQIWFQPLINSIIIFYIFRMIVLFLKLYKYAPFRNLHLFLYICSTELLPLMVGFKIFIN